MDNQNYDKAENAVNKMQWKANDYAERAKDYIREQRARNEEPTQEGWFNTVKENVSDAWESTKDAAHDAWESTKNWADETWEKTKDAAEDAKAEFRKATN